MLCSRGCFVYEAVLTLSASVISLDLNTTVVNEMKCVGSLLIIGIGINMLKVNNIKVEISCLYLLFLYRKVLQIL
ncbi:MAG: DUF554 domain-containing protein [Clostridiales bacterium]|nr:DUF554 domain-containing protein [Clostridiales bacterium]